MPTLQSTPKTHFNIRFPKHIIKNFDFITDPLKNVYLEILKGYLNRRQVTFVQKIYIYIELYILDPAVTLCVMLYTLSSYKLYLRYLNFENGIYL